MKITLGITAFSRPQYLLPTLKAWAEVRIPDNVRLTKFASVDYSKDQRLICNMLESYGWQSFPVVDPGFGCPTNTAKVLELAFFTRPDFIVMAEDDVPPFADVLEYLTWCALNANHPDVAAVCAHADNDDLTGLGVVEKRNWFTPWVWGTWPDRVPTFLDMWDHDYSHGGWDVNVNERIRLEYGYCVYPVCSRSDNIGQHGVHNDGSIPLHHAPSTSSYGRVRFSLRPHPVTVG